MKDKLEKTGHKKFYYRVKTVFTVILFTLAVIALSAIPVGITFKLAEAKAKAEPETSQKATDLNSSDMEVIFLKFK